MLSFQVELCPALSANSSEYHLGLVNIPIDSVWVHAGFQSNNALNVLNEVTSAANEVMMPLVGKLVERTSGADISHHH